MEEGNNGRNETITVNNNSPLTLGSILSVLPLLAVLATGFGVYNNLQLQISELRISADKDSAFLKETLADIRVDLQELKDANKKHQQGQK